MIKHAQNLFLHLCSLKLLPYGKCFSVHHFHGVEALRQPHHGVPYLAEVDIADVAASKPPQEAEVFESEAAFVASESPHGLPGGLVCLMGLGVRAREQKGGVCCGGADRDRAPARAAAEAEVGHPAPG